MPAHRAETGLSGRLRNFTRDHGAPAHLRMTCMTGFRIAYGGRPGKFGVTPDLTTLGPSDRRYAQYWLGACMIVAAKFYN